MQTLEEQFNTRLNAFLGSTGLRPTTFGMKALGDPNLMRQLDGGRSLSLRTADRVLAFVADSDLDSGGPRTPPRGHRRRKPSSRARRTRSSRAMSEQPIEQRTNPPIRFLRISACRGADGPVADHDLRLVGTGALPPGGPAERARGALDRVGGRGMDG